MHALIALALGATQFTAAPQEVALGKTGDDWSRITVSLSFDVHAGDEIALEFVERWGPAQELTRLISEVRLSGPDGPVPHTREGASLRATDLPAGRIELRYDVAQDYAGEPQWGVQRMPGMRPVLQKDYAFFAGGAVLPQFADAEVKVTVSFPDGGVMNRPLDAAQRNAAVPYAALSNGLFAFGDFRVHEDRSDAGVHLRSALRGTWRLDDATVHAATQQTLRLASELFDDAVFEQYFVLLTPLPPLPQGSSVIGSGFDEAFFLLATPNAEADNLLHTLTHEVLHEWIPRRAGRTDEATDPSRAWFTEGFTEYFTQRLLLQSGRITLDAFVANFNALWSAYQASDVNTLPAAALNERLFESEQTERLPYQRGALLALHWDTELKRAGRPGLAQVLAELIDRADALEAEGRARTLSDDALAAALRAALGERFDLDHQRHIIAGERIDIGQLSLPDCIGLDAQSRLHLKPEPAALEDCTGLITRR